MLVGVLLDYAKYFFGLLGPVSNKKIKQKLSVREMIVSCSQGKPKVMISKNIIL